MEAYLDNAATTRVSDGVREIMERTMAVDFGNPSSKHRKGMEAERYLRDAAEQAAKSLRAEPKEIVFTSGGTEANNLALIGTALAMRRRGKHLIAAQFEHASVNSPLLFLEEMGFDIDFVPVDGQGHVCLSRLYSLVRPDTVLVSLMYVNNEIGAVQDIAALSAAVKKKNPGVLFHSDAVQAYGKYRIHPKKEGIDLLSVSGHKIHGPKGSGFLYIREGVRIRPILWGGGQQRGLRSGTENVPAIAGLGCAVREIYEEHESKISRMYGLKEHLIGRLAALPGVTVNAVSEPITGCAPHIVSASFEGVRSEVLLHALEERGVYVSSGSACSSNHPGISGSLRAIGLREDLLDSTLRFSFSVYTRENEIDYAALQLGELLPVLRRYTKR